VRSEDRGVRSERGLCRGWEGSPGRGAQTIFPAYNVIAKPALLIDQGLHALARPCHILSQACRSINFR
jgi:hypothetical protein